jgi:hypothetical protein
MKFHKLPNKDQQSDSVSLAPFVQKDAQKSPSLLRSCGWRYIYGAGEC